LAACFVATATSGGKQEPAVKFNLDYLDKTWHIKFKSAVYIKPSSPSVLPAWKFTLEFTKDIEDTEGLKKAFSNKSEALVFWLFDEDNVSIGRGFIGRTEGELSGKAGDAFRVLIEVTATVELQKARKLEVRPATKK
jgi:hypothetical protein